MYVFVRSWLNTNLKYTQQIQYESMKYKIRLMKSVVKSTDKEKGYYASQKSVSE